MAKRDQAFELFSQGKKPGDPDLEVLGLKRESQKKYFRDWKKTEIEPAVEVASPPVVVVASPVMVRAGSIKPKDKFEFRGKTYQAKGKEPGFLVAVALGQQRITPFNFNVMVKPVK